MAGTFLKTLSLHSSQRQNLEEKIKFLFVKLLGIDITLEKFC